MIFFGGGKFLFLCFCTSFVFVYCYFFINICVSVYRVLNLSIFVFICIIFSPFFSLLISEMDNDTEILQWLEEVFEDEQDVAPNNTTVDSSHDSGSKTEESESSQDIPKSSEYNYFLSRHT